MTYVFLTVLSSLFLGLYDLFKKISLNKSKDIYEILFFYTFLSFLCSLFFVKDALNIDIIFILFILLKAFIISISWFFTMKAMSKLDLGIVVPFSLLGTVSTTILSWLFFKENIVVMHIYGIGIILIGLLFLAKICRNNNSKNDYRYLLLLVMAAFLSSVSAIIDRYLLNNISYGSVLFWFFLFLAFIYFIVYIFKNKRICISRCFTNIWVFGIAFSIFISDLLYYLAVSDSDSSLSIISIVRKLSVFIGVALGSVFLKEKKTFVKIIILLLMFVGLWFILFL